jgi:UDP-N-acetylglucosamine pyrophosphorylase
MPAQERNGELNWNPPGHGDIYAALLASGLAERLLALGKRYMFVANADNLGATAEPAILGYFAQSGAPFLMETAERTKADAKGGHLARNRKSGRLILRESSQAPTTPAGEIIPEFQDVSKYRHFNTNNIWLDLEAVVRVAREHDGCIPLPLISNRKTVNPRDRTSRPVIQVETAMGAAIEVFDGARALQVPRSRFAPVKSNSDLLVVRSDAYELKSDYTVVVSRDRTLPGLPLVSLDSHYYGLLKDFEARVKVVPSLVEAESFTVQGDVIFSHALKIKGHVKITSGSSGSSPLPADTCVLDNEESAV